MSAAVRISNTARNTLKHLSLESGESMLEIFDKAIEMYHRRHFLEEANKAYAALRSSKKAWQQELEERAAWDTTLTDGLAED